MGLWPLAALMAGATVDTTAAVAERIARSALPRAERSELTGPLRADELAALRGADEPLLRSLAAHVATDSREQLRAFLGLPPLME